MKQRLAIAAGVIGLAVAAALTVHMGILNFVWKKAPPIVFHSAPTPVPTPTPCDDTVAFTRAGSLWIEHSDGSDARLLATPGGDSDFWFPSADPNGDAFAVWLSRGDGTQDVALVDLDGKSTVLTDLGEQANASMQDLDLENGPSWSPDGQRIAYSFNGHLWLMDADGTDQQTLISDGESWCPAWSPDGRQLAYVNGADGHRDLWITSVDNRDTYQVTDFEDYSVSAPHWSPDGKRILLTRVRGNETDIVVVTPSGDAPVSDADIVTKDHQSASAVFSPTGGRILFSSARAGSYTWDLYAGDILGNAAQQVTHGGGLSPTWAKHASGAFQGGGASPAPSVAPKATPTTAPTPRPTAPAAKPTPVSAAPASPGPALAPSTPTPATHTPRASAQAAPAAAPAPATLQAASLRLRLRVGFDDQDALDAASERALKKLAHRVRQYPQDTLDVVGPLDGSPLRGLYGSDEERSQTRAQTVGESLAHLAGLKASAVQAEPYSPPSSAGRPGSVLIYLQLR